MLAGGRGRRMTSGGASSLKGLEQIGDQRIIDRVAAALRGVTCDLLVVANDPASRGWLPDVASVPDVHAGAGGLAGVEAALVHAAERDVIVVAWDMPFVTTALLRALHAALRSNDADVALPASESPYGFEPFCAAYSARALPPLSAYLSRGGGPARDFLRRLPRVHVIPREEIVAIGDPDSLFLSVNTPADLERARAMAEHAT